MSSMTKNPFLLAVVATAALALGACGSGNDDNSPSSRAKADDKAFEGALKFAKCMREHGQDVPDPTRGAGGGVLQKMGKGSGPQKIDQAAMQKAQKACEHFMSIGGGGPAPSPAEQAKRQDAFIAYAQCMREHGVDMPDPQFSGDGNGTFSIGIASGPDDSSNSSGPVFDPDSQEFKDANAACGQNGGGFSVSSETVPG
jgi:hypothetical protein